MPRSGEYVFEGETDIAQEAMRVSGIIAEIPYFLRIDCNIVI